MIVGVVVCPGAPLLVPGLAPGLAAIAQDLVDGCASAIASLRHAERILLLTSGPRPRDQGGGPESTIQHPPGTPVSTASLTDGRPGRYFSSALAGSAELVTAAGTSARPAASTRAIPADSASAVPADPPGVGVIVGAALLEAAGVAGPTTAVELGDLDRPGGASPADPEQDLDDLRHVIGGPADRVGLLVIGEGTASRGPDSPGGGHEGAEAFDASLAGALAAGDPVALRTAVAGGRARASQMLWTSGPSFGALAVLCADLPPARAELLYDAAPFGVGYLVATWTWA